MHQPNLLSVHEALDAIESGELSARELLDSCLRQIDRLNPELDAFITLSTDTQSMGVRTLPKQDSAHGKRDPVSPAGRKNADSLQGIPIAVKDLIETENQKTTAGSLFFRDYVPTTDAAVVRRIRAAGAVVIGKTNTHEIALGVTTQNPHYGSCRNPWDKTRIPGGSSGGSAVAVATGMALAALGTDTGGSIRIPASLCGTVGLKPTYGRISLRGIFPLSWNLDHAGPLASTVEDAALLLQVMAGYDAKDASSVNRDVDDYLTSIDQGINRWRIGLAVGEYVEGAETEVLEAVGAGAKMLAARGAIVEEIDISFLREAALANGLMTQADGAAYHRERLAEHPEWFGSDVRQRLEAGRSLTSTEYSLARRTQAEMKRRMDQLFAAYEILLLPTTPITAPPIEAGDAVERAKRLTRFTAPFNLTGVPAISVPCGLSANGLPIGLQMVAAAWEERKLLRAAYAFEKAMGAGPRRPALATL